MVSLIVTLAMVPVVSLSCPGSEPGRISGRVNVSGIAPLIGAQVANLAAAGEVLVSSTVKDLVAGSGIEFADKGVHTLAGVPDDWRLFAVIGARARPH